MMAGALLLAGCIATPDPEPTATDAPAPSPTASQDDAPEDVVTAEATYLGVPLTVDVHPVQVAGDVALLTVDYSIGDGAPQDAQVTLGPLLQPPTGPIGAGGVRMVDVDAGVVHPVGEDSTQQPATTRDAMSLAAGKSVQSQSFYAAPASATVGVLFPFLGMVLDVPVEVLPSGEELPTTPADLGREGEVTYTTAPLDAFTVAYDDSSSARVAGDAATVSLASDVLFAPDVAVLTPEATAVVADAAQKMASVAAGGEVHVVGHTDDVASDEYNQTLSVQRAQAVTAVLSAQLGSDFTVTPEGRGESEPAIPGTSPEARAANRRVEITFTAKENGMAVEVGGSVPAPEPTGPVATGDEQAELTLRGEEWGVRARSVVRHGPYLVGELEVERLAPGSGGMLEFFGSASAGLDLKRGLPSTTIVAGAHNVSLLGESSRYYPFDYVRQSANPGEEQQRRTLADQFLSAQLDQGDVVTVTVVWPDPGGDTVSIDVPDRFRLVDVPVTEG